MYNNSLQSPVIHTLETDGVYLTFGDRNVLQNVYIKVETGKVTGLLGRNGCGKSCLMRIMYGSLDIPSKSVRIDGHHVKYAYSHGVVFAPQHDFIPPARTLKNIMSDCRLDFEHFASVFPSMEKYYRNSIGILSGGERRLVEIYTVLCSDSLFCLLDEPFSQIMPLYIEVIKGLIASAKQTKGILVSDHMYRDILAISDGLYVITSGQTYLTTSNDDLRRLGYTK